MTVLYFEDDEPVILRPPWWLGCVTDWPCDVEPPEDDDGQD